jgi:hypothetical protein
MITYKNYDLLLQNVAKNFSHEERNKRVFAVSGNMPYFTVLANTLCKFRGRKQVLLG